MGGMKAFEQDAHHSMYGHSLSVVPGQAGELGEPKGVLQGHTNVVSFVEFCPSVACALLSSSFDGTCRIWNAADASAPAIVLDVGSHAPLSYTLFSSCMAGFHGL